MHISDFLDLLATIVNQCLQIPLKRIKNVIYSKLYICSYVVYGMAIMHQDVVSASACMYCIKIMKFTKFCEISSLSVLNNISASNSES